VSPARSGQSTTDRTKPGRNTSRGAESSACQAVTDSFVLSAASEQHRKVDGGETVAPAGLFAENFRLLRRQWRDRVGRAHIGRREIDLPQTLVNSHAFVANFDLIFGVIRVIENGPTWFKRDPIFFDPALSDFQAINKNQTVLSVKNHFNSPLTLRHVRSPLLRPYPHKHFFDCL
jgi:hypothetical protein